MAELKDTALGDMLPEMVDGVSPGNGGNVALGALRYNSAQTLGASERTQARANAGIFYGTCSTSSSSATKVVTCATFTSSHLVEGTILRVKFTNDNSYQYGITLNVNSTGAKTVGTQNGLPTGTLNAAWGANSLVTFVYDGTYWRIDNSAPAVRFASQSLTDSQKSQARTNIGATLTNARGYGNWEVNGSGPNEETIFIVLTSDGGWEPRYYDESAADWVSCGGTIYSRDATYIYWSDNPYEGSSNWGPTYIGSDFSASRSTNWNGTSPWIPDPPMSYDPNSGGMYGPPDSPSWDDESMGYDQYSWMIWSTSYYDYECTGYYDAQFSPVGMSSDYNATSVSATFSYYDCNYSLIAERTFTWRRQVLRGAVYAGDVSRTLALQSDLDSALSHVSNTSNPHSVTKSQVGLGNVDNVSARQGIFVFDAGRQYYSGDCCIRSNALFRFTASHKGAWNASHVDLIADLSNAAPASGGTSLITNGQVYDALQNVAGGSYTIETITPTYSTTTSTNDTAAVTLKDKEVNVVSLANTVTSATFTLPAALSGSKARDFILRLTITGDVPTIYFKEPSGSAVDPTAANNMFDADDDSWAEIEQGVNILMFAETQVQSS